MDKLQWFKFTPTDWVMGKIQRCPEITQARFMRLVCLYWNKECLLSYEDAEIEIDKEHLDILISKKVIKNDNGFLVVEFLNEQLENIAETSEKRRNAVLQRWNKVKQVDTSVLQNNTIVLQSDTEESREELDKIRKDNIDSRKSKFASTLQPYLLIYGKDMLNDFYAYWTEHGEHDKKFRSEKEKSFSIERRLETWKRNEKTFNKQPKTINYDTADIRARNPNI